MQIWKDSKYAFQEKQGREGGRGKAIRKISKLYRVFSIEGFPYGYVKLLPQPLSTTE
jgi:hypothetical protein